MAKVNYIENNGTERAYADGSGGEAGDSRHRRRLRRCMRVCDLHGLCASGMAGEAAGNRDDGRDDARFLRAPRRQFAPIVPDHSERRDRRHPRADAGEPALGRYLPALRRHCDETARMPKQPGSGKPRVCRFFFAEMRSRREGCRSAGTPGQARIGLHGHGRACFDPHPVACLRVQGLTCRDTGRKCKGESL